MSELRETVELQRLIAETRKLQQESDKFVAEQRKLIVEAQKLDKERWWFPWLQLLTVVISSATIGAVVARLFH